MHEMRHIAKTIDQLLESEGGEELRQLALEAGALLKKDKLSQKRVYCTDPILNAVFMEREKMAGESKVAYEVDIQPGLCLDFINETDKIRIFGNLLDNALEACGKLSPGEDRWIRVQARPIKKCFLLEIKNCTDLEHMDAVRSAGKHPVHGHGIGL